MTSYVSQVYQAELPKFDRVRKKSPKRINRKIDEKVQSRLDDLSLQSRDKIQKRLNRLEKEWDVDRALIGAFSVLGGTVFLLGEKANRNWLYFFSVQLGFLFYHALKGWCPPAAVLRCLGFRTVREIDAEKFALETALK